MKLCRVNLVNARKQKRLTQGELGRLVGITKQSISKTESGQTSTSAENWDKIEDILGVPQHTLREIFEVEEVYHAKANKEKPE